MSAARITIGGVDVNPQPNDAIDSTQRAVDGQGAVNTDHAFSRAAAEVASVSLTLERSPWSTCPLPPGPWRIIGAVALGGLILSMIACLIHHRTHPS